MTVLQNVNNKLPTTPATPIVRPPKQVVQKPISYEPILDVNTMQQAPVVTIAVDPAQQPVNPVITTVQQAPVEALVQAPTNTVSTQSSTETTKVAASEEAPKVKKAFERIYDVMNETLKVNPFVKLADIMPDLLKIMQTAKTKVKVNSAVTFRDEAGVVRGIRCNFFKRFMPLEGDMAVAFAEKATSATGYHNACVEGTEIRNAKNREFNRINKEIMGKAMRMEIDQSTMISMIKEAEAERDAVPETSLGFETKEELIQYYGDVGINLISSK